MADKRWSFDWADIEITGKKIVVNSLINYKDLEKKYKDLIDNLSKENQEFLKRAFAKKRIREEEISASEKDELVEFFNRLEIREGSGAEAVTRKPVPAVATAATTRAATPTKGAEEPVESKYAVKIIESLDFNTKHNGEIINSTVNGQIAVINDGEKNHIWDIDVELSGGDNTDLKEKKFHINDLPPKKDWTKDYKIEITPEDKPPVVITEKIDTFPDTKAESHTFILNEESEGQPVEFQISIENTSKSKVSNVNLTKMIPEDIKDVKVAREGKGKAKETKIEDTNNIVWEVPELEAGETADLTFKAKVYPTKIKNIPSGELKIKYMLEAGTYSGLKPSFVDGLSDEIYLIDRNERDQEPDTWDCQFAFTNRSEFPMKLQKFQVVSGDENTEYETITQEPNIVINPSKEWTSEAWELKSEDEPTFSESVLYTVHPRIEERLSMSSTIQALELQVLAVSGIKDFSKNVLRSYRAETLDVAITATIKGDSPIDVIHLEDTIPKDFKNPDKSAFNFYLDITGKKKSIPVDDFSVSFEPSLGPDDVSVERKMKIEVKDVLENIGMVTHESTVVVKYPLNAVRPARDAKYDAPVLFQAFTKPRGAIIETYIEPEPITVIHERRRTRIGKSIRPGVEKGQYDILLIYQNNGDSVKNNIKISDFVPASFKILESKKEYEQKSQDDGTLLTWIIEKIAPNESVEINYIIRGEGSEYSLKNIEARAYK